MCGCGGIRSPSARRYRVIRAVISAVLRGRLSELFSPRSAEELPPAAGAGAMERPGHGRRRDREHQAPHPAPGAVGGGLWAAASP